MKKMTALIAIIIIAILIFVCADQKPQATVEETITSEYKTYYKMSDGTWATDTHFYKYRLEISGRMSNAAKDITFVYLSNMENISFDQAWKAAGLSSSTKDYFSLDEAVLVELK